MSSAASCSATPGPIPLFAPVTNATFWCVVSSLMTNSLLSRWVLLRTCLRNLRRDSPAISDMRAEISVLGRDGPARARQDGMVCPPLKFTKQ